MSSTVCLEFGSGLARNREAGHPTQGDHPLELGLVQAEPLKNARILQCFTAGGFGRMLRQSDLLGYSGFRFQSIYIYLYILFYGCAYTPGVHINHLGDCAMYSQSTIISAHFVLGAEVHKAVWGVG